MVTAITGLPGSGKTFLATALAARIKGKHISSDGIRFMLEQHDYDTQAKSSVYELMLAQMEEAIKAGLNVVLDATFYKERIRRRFIEKAHQYQTPFYLIKLEAAEAVIKERVSKRRSDSEADFQAYLMVKSEYEPLTENHLILHSDQTTLADLLGKALSFINYHDEPKGN